jgi:HPt (histidine-containing phosphotransfer) domain-containing protein
MHQAQPYELILMDCQMPGMDGREAASRIRALEGAASRVPVVAVTACATPSERECCLSAGMDDFIAKPLRPQVLDAALTKWLAVQNVTAPIEQPCNDELDAVRNMFGADFAELAALYMNDSPPRITRLQAAGVDGDSATVAKVAHAFSGSSASIGASGLAALCKELEQEAKAGKLDQFAHRMAAIELEYGRICSRIQALLNQ